MAACVIAPSLYGHWMKFASLLPDFIRSPEEAVAVNHTLKLTQRYRFMINRITMRPACVNAVYVCFGSMDKLQPGKLVEVLCHVSGVGGAQQQ